MGKEQLMQTIVDEGTQLASIVKFVKEVIYNGLSTNPQTIYSLLASIKFLSKRLEYSEHEYLKIVMNEVDEQLMIDPYYPVKDEKEESDAFIKRLILEQVKQIQEIKAEAEIEA